MTIYKKLMAVQSSLKVPKTQVNKFGGYNYRSLEDICEAVKPHLEKEGLVIVMSDEPVVIDGWHYVKATIKLIDVESGEIIENSASAREPADKKGSDASQITGAASSYARKYAMNAMLLTDDTKDADSQDNRQEHVTLDQVKSLISKAGSKAELSSVKKQIAMLPTKEDRDIAIKAGTARAAEFDKAA